MIDIERMAFMAGIADEAHEDPDSLAASMVEVYSLAREMLEQADDPFFAARARQQIGLFDELWTNPLAPAPVIPEPPMEVE
jgi:hypothetical protein